VGKTSVARPTAAKVQRVDDDLCDVQCIDAHKVTASRKAAKQPQAVQTATDIFRVLGDPTRLRIVDALTRHELCVCDLALIVNASQSTVSHSLRALRQLRLVKYRKEGKIAFYSLDDHHISNLLKTAFEHAAES
jgi:ArsR family transcriptional regulator, lead/cadmium/zinc/bismuth-responsive transcriptional repressor